VQHCLRPIAKYSANCVKRLSHERYLSWCSLSQEHALDSALLAGTVSKTLLRERETRRKKEKLGKSKRETRRKKENGKARETGGERKKERVRARARESEREGLSQRKRKGIRD